MDELDILHQELDGIKGTKMTQEQKNEKAIEKLQRRREIVLDVFKFLTGFEMLETQFIEYNEMFEYFSENQMQLNIKDYLNYLNIDYTGRSDELLLNREKIDEVIENIKDFKKYKSKI